MNTKFKKLALSAGIATALGGFSLPSHAIIEGAAGEALLVPFVIYDTAAVINTIVELTIPGTVGLDTIPNDFTASHSTPVLDHSTIPPSGPSTSFNNPALSVHHADVVNNSKVHWYFFDKNSVHKVDGAIPVTADDFVQFDWGREVRRQNGTGGKLDGMEGYLVFGTEQAREAGPTRGSHKAANFSFFGDAYLVTQNAVLLEALGIVDAKIPVLPMNDGEDPGFTTPPTLPKVTIDNQVIYNAANVPEDASPLVSGMRTVWSDGIPNVTLFDLTLGLRIMPTLQVFWNDHNGGDGYFASADVFDDAENTCSFGNVPLPNEVNSIWVAPLATEDLAPFWVDVKTELCYPNGFDSAARNPGFVRYVIPEQGDTNIGVPEQAAVAFSIVFDATSRTNGIIPVETALGHERGKFF
ncbi:MAG: hypothetical protein WCH01_19305 [Methylococcaceae bacterium]